AGADRWRIATPRWILGQRARRDPRQARPARLGTIGALTNTIFTHNGSALSSGSRSGTGDGPAFGSGGSFLGTAASTAAGVIGGGLVLNSIRSMFGDHAGLCGHERSALGSSSGSSADSYPAQQDRDQDQDQDQDDDDQAQEDQDQDQDQAGSGSGS